MTPDPLIPLADCSICSQLDDIETSFYKYGWDDMDIPLPPVASRLVILNDPSEPDPQNRHTRRCPECGTFYRYQQSYEYIVNGSEDEEVLTRLTPAEARRFFDDETFASLMGWMEACLTHAEARTRRYAARCLTANHLQGGELEAVRRLLHAPDPEVRGGALAFLLCEQEKGNSFPTLRDDMSAASAHLQKTGRITS